MTGFPPLCAMCHVPAEGEFEGACPLMHAPPRAVPSAASMWRAETESAAANGRRIPEWYTRGRV